MSYPAVVWRVVQSIIGAFVLAAIVASLYPYIPRSGPFGIRGIFEQVINFVIPAIVIGVGTIAWWLVDDGGF